MGFSTLWIVVKTLALFVGVGCGDEAEQPNWCQTDADCEQGLYCDLDSGICVQDCTEDHQCPGEQVCAENGQCASPDTDTETGSSNPDPCGDSVLLIVDRSSSMANDGKWEPLLTELTDVLNTYGEGTDYGLEVFPDNSCADDYTGTDTTVVCRSPDNLEVDIGSSSTASIVDTLEMVGTCGGTPTTGALGKALEEVTSHSSEVQVVLISDGLPNCNVDIAFEDCVCLLDNRDQCETFPENCLDDVAAQAVAHQLSISGTPVHVISYAVESEWLWALDELAATGGTGAAIQCGTADDVGQALSQILDSIVNC